MTSDALERLDRLEAELRAIEAEFEELRATVLADEPVPAAGPAPPSAGPEPAPQPPRPPAPQPPRPPASPPSRRDGHGLTAPPRARGLKAEDLLGARALAWAGGVVTLLGIVFFFVLAARRGWIGPLERVGLGSLASILAFSAGLWLRRRFGETYAALSAVGAGIAGAYATLVAAGALYGLVEDVVALAVAAGIASVGLLVALRWRSETIAALGLLGAMAVPAIVVVEGDLSVLGTSFVAIVLAASAAVTIREGWRRLLLASLVVSLPQISLLVAAEGEPARARVLALTALFAGLYLAAGIFRQLRSGALLDALAATLVIVPAALTGYSAAWLLDGELGRASREGAAVLAVAIAYGVLAAVFFRRPGAHDLGVLLAAVALAMGAIAGALLLGGAALVLAWAAEAAVLAWLASKTGEPRFGFASLAYLWLALGHALVYEARLEDLVRLSRHPADGALPLLAIALAASLYARYAGDWRQGPRRPDWPEQRLGLGAMLDRLASDAALWREPVAWAAGLCALYAASLGTLELFAALADERAAGFAWGHAGISALWALAAGGVLLAGRSREWERVKIGGLVWSGAAAWWALSAPAGLSAVQSGWSALAVALPLLVAGFLYDLVGRDRAGLSRPALGLGLGAGALAAVGLVEALEGDVQGGGFLAVAGLFALLSASVFGRPGRRDLRTLHWAGAVAFALAAAPQLIEGTPLAATLAVASAALAVAALVLREPRLLLGSFAPAAGAIGYTLAELAPPDALFRVNSDPAGGVPALLVCAGSLAVLAWCLRKELARPADALDLRLEERRPRLRAGLAGGGFVLLLGAASLGLLELFQQLGSAELATEFQRGHTAVSALWGAVGLVALLLGLTRRSTPLRAGGFALFGLSLAKLFLYDLSTLSSVTRALSFLAVGAALLVAGFLYQRLSGAGGDDSPAGRALGG